VSVFAGLVLVDAAASKWCTTAAWLIATPSVSHGARANAPAVAHRSNQVAAVVSAGHRSKVSVPVPVVANHVRPAAAAPPFPREEEARKVVDEVMRSQVRPFWYSRCATRPSSDLSARNSCGPRASPPHDLCWVRRTG
jgi:hypothetical protein